MARLVPNTGNERVIDEVRPGLTAGTLFDVCTSALSIYAFANLGPELKRVSSARIALQSDAITAQKLAGGPADRSARNRLSARAAARGFASWIGASAAVRAASSALPQSALIVRPGGGEPRATVGSCPFTTEGLGVTPGNQFGFVQAAHGPESEPFLAWFDALWASLPSGPEAKAALIAQLERMGSHGPPWLLYNHILFQLFRDLGEEFDEDRIIKSATGIRQTSVWRKLFRFQRDGVVGAIDKLERFGGCIVADSVGLGKTFEALAIIKYYELRNDRVLVLCPKRLRDNWTLYKANDRRNSLAQDRFNYDVLNHTDLSRDDGTSGDIDLSHVNWGNYDLVVIDESHNFRNKKSHKERETRYDRLMRRVIREGVKTRVLMLSATPVNNRLADLKNQIAFVTEGVDKALEANGIPSVEACLRNAQLQFNKWLALEDAERRPQKLMEMLGFDYFKLLDLLTIARSRKHIEKYYGTEETGKFPERLKPENFKPEVDRAGAFPSIREINNEIRRLNLAAYAPLRYVLPAKQAQYDVKYSQQIRGGESFFRQVDREESLIHLLRVNVLKRMESAVSSFALTVSRQLADVDALLAKLDAHGDSVEEIAIGDIDVDDPAFEALLVGTRVRVLLRDVDLVRWRQDLAEDRNRLAALLSAARQVGPERDAKLAQLRAVIERKARAPLNPGNRKVLVFTAFADTAQYLFEDLSPWARERLGMHTAIVTGAGRNKATLPGLRTDLSSILSAFAPRAKERPPELAEEGEIELLIATDCISEGQNLQDCDTLINYDIHWNPVRIIQRFGRIDRIGSPNERIQLINFWPNLELEEYINLEQRVSGRMVLLDISATGEENLIEQQSGNQMNDLEYRRKQLLRLQDSVIDLEDLSSGISIADLTLTDFRIDLGAFLRDHRELLESMPLGAFAAATAPNGEGAIPPGVIFCLRAETGAAQKAADPGYPLAPHYLVHVSEGGSVILQHTQVKQLLDRLKRVCIGRERVDAAASARFDRETRNGEDMSAVVAKLGVAVASVLGRREERAVASLFTPGGTHAMRGEFAGIDDFEVVAMIAVLPEEAAGAA